MDLLELDPEAFRAGFGRRPFRVRHRLTGHPLFSVPRLVELSKSLPPSSVEHNDGDVPLTLDPARTPRTRLSPEETIGRIEECRSWLVLKNVEQDPDYRELLESCLSEVRRLSEAVSPGMAAKEGFVFVSSRGAVTPYHLDPEQNFLLQVRGEKTLAVFDPADRTVLSEKEVERFLGGAHRNLSFREEHRERAQVFHLGPGSGIHVPVTAPHWVRNGAEVSVSFSITFQTADSIRRAHAHRMNAHLRRWGIRPAPVGASAVRDGLKQLAHRARCGAYRLLRVGRP